MADPRPITGKIPTGLGIVTITVDLHYEYHATVGSLDQLSGEIFTDIKLKQLDS
ncbi:hypothetical protein PMG71_06495 [Roseofilum sp. BLCC_M154]|uniref:Uncharacterized protein n=1 Tax=Roseofilum acuticapitatum BLCC-M154 TaxID=3022444 RepID=A0ABT7ARZ2_9CYAN|nr:hypothetical protein [Roseofilum acuticapitatum]MDJ1169071.1 hypothetical protein [Roseofilum acuticapitatum BLCC-M154]